MGFIFGLCFLYCFVRWLFNDNVIVMVAPGYYRTVTYGGWALFWFILTLIFH